MHDKSICDTKDSNARAFVIGCNRSGSTLLFTVLQEIRSLLGIEGDTRRESGLKAYKQYKAWMSMLDGCFKTTCNCHSASGSTRFSGMDYFCAGKGQFIYIAHLPLQRYRFDSVYRTYSILDERVLGVARVNGIGIYCPIRNPLDVIVSNAFELENLLFWMYPERLNQNTLRRIRDAYGRAFLNNLAWVESMALLIKQYNKAHLKYRKQTYWVKYEELINDPEPTVQGIGEELGVEVTEDLAAEIWRKVGFQPLTRWPSHYFRPGEGKWREYFTEEHLALLEDLDMRSCLSEMGYQHQFDCSSLVEGANQVDEDLAHGAQVHDFVAVRDACFALQFGKEMNFGRDGIEIRSASVRGETIRCASNSRRLLQAFDEMVESSAFLSGLSMVVE